MKTLLILSLVLSGFAVNAASNDAVKNSFANGVKNATCDATSYIMGSPYKTAKAEISLDTSDTENPLVTVKSKEKELSFKIGQRNYNGRVHDDHKACELRYVANDDPANVISYVCVYKGEIEAMEAYTRDTVSAKLFSTADGSRFTTICKGDITGSSMGCYSLTNCK